MEAWRVKGDGMVSSMERVRVRVGDMSAVTLLPYCLLRPMCDGSMRVTPRKTMS